MATRSPRYNFSLLLNRIVCSWGLESQWDGLAGERREWGICGDGELGRLPKKFHFRLQSKLTPSLSLLIGLTGRSRIRASTSSWISSTPNSHLKPLLWRRVFPQNGWSDESRLPWACYANSHVSGPIYSTSRCKLNWIICTDNGRWIELWCLYVLT